MEKLYVIAVCDHDALYAEYMEKLFRESGADSIIFYYYSSGDEMLKQYSRKYDLVIMDMCLTGKSGVETAAELRKHDSDMLLVYSSTSSMPTPECIKTEPFRFLMKNMTRQELRLEVREIMEKMKENKEFCYIMGHENNYTNYYHINADEILYISKLKRARQIHWNGWNNQWIPIRSDESMNSIYMKLKDHGFEYAHCSCLINFRFVKAVYKDRVLLKNGIILEMSRRRHDFFCERMKEFTK